MALIDDDRNIMIDLYMEKAVKALNSAILLSETNDYDGAANRAYYSVFQSGSALLLTKDILRYSHKHVRKSILEEFEKSGKLPIDINSKIKKLETMRTISDYSKTESVTEEEIKEALSEAKKFLDNAKKLIAEFKLEQKKEISEEHKNAENNLEHEKEEKQKKIR